MLRICIPVHNEATTIGVLLWRLRSVFQGFSREYDVVVYDDASTDGTGEVLEPYQSVMPLTVLRGAAHRGYAASIDALVRHVAADDEYARRDAMVLLQGDFTESPEHLPELVKRFEGGADLVAVHRTMSDATPHDERRLRRWGRWAVKPFLRLPPVADPFTGFRLVRISVLRELLKALGARPVCAGEGWAANIDFALNVTPFSRRIENVEFAPRYDVRQRASRRRGWPDVVALFHWARSARGTIRPSPGSKPTAEPASRTPAESAAVSLPLERGARLVPSERVDRAAGRPERGGRSPREVSEPRGGAAGPATRPQRDERPAREERLPKEARGAREERALRGEERQPRPEHTERPPREPRPPRPERPAREERIAAAPPAVDEPDTELVVNAAMPAPGEVDGGTPASDTPASEKKSRRRRRRSRRERGAAAADGTATAGVHVGTTEAHSGDGDETESGTSDDGEGEEEAGGDDTTTVESGVGGDEQAGEGAHRKRRNRRRRRGRRPGGPDGAAPDNASPPAAEPPAA